MTCPECHNETLRACATDEPSCKHCDACGWCGERFSEPDPERDGQDAYVRDLDCSDKDYVLAALSWARTYIDDPGAAKSKLCTLTLIDDAIGLLSKDEGR